MHGSWKDRSVFVKNGAGEVSRSCWGMGIGKVGGLWRVFGLIDKDLPLFGSSNTLRG